MRVRRFCGFVAGGAVTEGVAGGVVWCVCGGQGSQIQKGAVTEGVVGGVVWCVCGGQGSQIQKGAVTEGVVGGVVWCVCGGQGSQIQTGAVTEGVVGGAVWCLWGSGFADPKGGCHRGCRWRCCLVSVGVRVRRSKRGLSQRVSLEVLSGVCGGQGSQIQKGAVTEGIYPNLTEYCACHEK